jgi:tetratricopeptide (TPR) repeat protein
LHLHPRSSCHRVADISGLRTSLARLTIARTGTYQRPRTGSHKALLHIVEKAHFTAEVEAGIRGATGTFAAGDLSYTLQRFPNHHRALVALANIGVREKTEHPKGTQFSIECWFQRAIIWGPDDVIVRLIYATHLIKTKRLAQAAVQAKHAAQLAADNPFTHLNLGLVYFDMENFDDALLHAHRASSLGLNISTLQELLTKVGKWGEPDDAQSQEAVKSAP